MEAKQLEELIQKKGIKKSFIAKKLGVSGALITNWCKGKRRITDRFVKQLEEILL